MSINSNDAYERVIIALDFPGSEQAEVFLATFNQKRKPFIKVGYQLFYSVGPKWVAKLKEEGYQIFLDLKLHDIPHTVARGIESLRWLGVDLLTLHASGGRAMIEAAREAAEKTSGERMKLLAVTQLTSTDQQMFNQEIGVTGKLEECVLRYARLAQQAGADGVICSGQEVSRVKSATTASFLAVTPGIRPAGNSVQDQKRVVTPAMAIKDGADYLVIGRPITHADRPLQAFHAIVEEIQHTSRGA